MGDMKPTLTEHEFAELSAWHDGELPPAQAEDVARKVKHDQAWTEANRHIERLDATLAGWPAPAVPGDLAERICEAARRGPQEHRMLRLVRWLSPLAAAAAIVLAVTFLHHPAALQQEMHTAQAVPEEFVREGLDVFDGLESGLTPAVRMSRQLNDQTPGLYVIVPGQPPQRWDDLTEAQKQQLRKRALAFLELTPRQQKQVLADYEQAVNTAQMQDAWRAQWLRAVVESFTPAERKALRAMQPGQRARLFIQRRNELIQSGNLTPPKR